MKNKFAKIDLKKYLHQNLSNFGFNEPTRKLQKHCIKLECQYGIEIFS